MKQHLTLKTQQLPHYSLFPPSPLPHSLPPNVDPTNPQALVSPQETRSPLQRPSSVEARGRSLKKEETEGRRREDIGGKRLEARDVVGRGKGGDRSVWSTDNRVAFK